MSTKLAAHSAFGRVEQRELEYMRLLRFDPLDRLLFAVLRVRYDARSRTVEDRISTLAEWSGLSIRSVERRLASLKRRGIIEREGRRNAGGPKAHGWRWSTSIRPYDDWPTGPMAALVVTWSAYLSVFYRPAPQAASSGKSPPQTMEEPAKNDPRARQTTRHNQESSPDISQERDASLEQRDEEDVPRDDPRRLGKLWVALRADAGLDRFLDDLAVRWLTGHVPDALRAGCSPDDLERAVRRYADVDFADPRKFLEWALAERDDRLRSERDIKRSRAHDAERQRKDAELERQRAEPGYDDRVRQILEDTRSRLGARPAPATSTPRAAGGQW